MDTIFKHLTRPKSYIFPAPIAPRSNAAPPESESTPRLVTSAQVLALYRQNPWNHYRRQVTPVSFHATCWFAELSTMYRDFETRLRQALWKAAHALYLPIEQRDHDPDPGRRKCCVSSFRGWSTDIAIWNCSWTPSSCISRRRSRCVHGIRVWMIHRRTNPI